MRIGQVMEDHRPRRIKQRPRPRRQRIPNPGLTPPQRIAGPIRPIRSERRRPVQLQRFQDRTVGPQPANRLALTRWMHHTRGHQGPGQARVTVRKPLPPENGDEVQRR